MVPGAHLELCITSTGPGLSGLWGRPWKTTWHSTNLSVHSGLFPTLSYASSLEELGRRGSGSGASPAHIRA